MGVSGMKDEWESCNAPAVEWAFPDLPTLSYKPTLSAQE